MIEPSSDASPPPIFTPTYNLSTSSSDAEISNLSKIIHTSPNDSSSFQTIKNFLGRPAINLIKTITAITTGGYQGVLQAGDTLCHHGGSYAIQSALLACLIRSGKENSILSIVNSKSSPSNLQPFLNQAEQYINSLPVIWFFAALIKGSVVLEACSSHSIAATKSAIAASKIEKIAVQAGIVNEQKKGSTTFIETVARISSWISSVSTVLLLGEMVHYALDSESYKKHTFSEHFEHNLIKPTQNAFNSIYSNLLR